MTESKPRCCECLMEIKEDYAYKTGDKLICPDCIEAFIGRNRGAKHCWEVVRFDRRRNSNASN